MTRRIAILGGGVAAMSAAFDLTSEPGWCARREVTVYQLGWRLGGKGASGRDLSRHGRIEEHGVHLWGGYYHNAFLLMRRCYEELGRAPGQPLARLEEAFRPRACFSLEELVDGERLRWDLFVPACSAMPGDGRTRPTAAEGLVLLRDALRLLGGALRRWRAASPAGRRHARRRARILADYALTHLRGVLADDLVTRGTAAVDGEDWAAWLRRHGAREQTLRSPLVRGIYDTMFAYRGGDPGCPEIAAGRLLHTYRRFALGYRGAPFFEMQAGMGDAVFAPLYEVLLRRGVRFCFFHRADRLRLDEGRRRVEAIDLTRQARPRDAAPYEPLVQVQGLPCWPSAPRWDQLAGGDQLARRGIDLEDPAVDPPGAEPVTLSRGVDFDDVVLAVGRGALPALCGEIVALDPRWARMLEHTPTVTTHALQRWCHGDAPAPAPRSVSVGGEAPLAVCADMTHVAPREAWPDGAPRHIAYWCGVLRTDQAFDASSWPGGHAGGDACAGCTTDTYYRRNDHPSDRYVLTPPGSVVHRLGADESGLTNLHLAGDWVRTSYSVGTVESACIAGRRAAEAILGRPLDILGEEGA